MPQAQRSAKACILLLSIGLATCLYWRLMGIIGAARLADSCPHCVCDCPSSFAEGSKNKSADCSSIMNSMRPEMGKSYVDSLIEELKLQVHTADDASKLATSALYGAKKLSSRYKKEAEKCNLGMETCEEAREIAMDKLKTEMKLALMWKKRALELGWKE